MLMKGEDSENIKGPSSTNLLFLDANTYPATEKKLSII